MMSTLPLWRAASAGHWVSQADTEGQGPGGLPVTTPMVVWPAASDVASLSLHPLYVHLWLCLLRAEDPQRSRWTAWAPGDRRWLTVGIAGKALSLGEPKGRGLDAGSVSLGVLGATVLYGQCVYELWLRSGVLCPREAPPSCYGLSWSRGHCSPAEGQGAAEACGVDV